MSSNWHELPLEDCMDAIIDYRGKTPRKVGSGIPLITAKIIKDGRILEPDEFIAPSDFDDWMTRGIPKPGDVVLTTEAPLGEVAQLDDRKIALAQRVITLSGKPSLLDNTFLKFLLQSRFVQDQLKGRSTGTTVLGVKQSELRKIILKLPPVSEQKVIAHILGTLDDKVELNRTINQTLEQMARALFKSWFIDFDPVRAKTDGRWKKGQSLPGLPAAMFDLFPSTFQVVDQDEVPVGWQVGQISSVSDLNPEVWTKGTRPSRILYVELSSVKWGRIEEIQEYSSDEAPSRAQRVLKPGDTIIGTVRPGNGSFTLISDAGLTGSTGFAVLRPRTNDYVEFVYLATTTTSNIDSLAHLADGAAYPAVRPEVVAGTKVCLPNEIIVKRFSEIVCPLLSQVSENERASRYLRGLRDLLLPKLVAGELRLLDATKFLGERGL